MASLAYLQMLAANIPAGEPGDLIDTNRLAIARAVLEKVVQTGPDILLKEFTWPIDAPYAPLLRDALEAAFQSLLPRE